jgi:hypothetical protein
MALDQSALSELLDARRAGGDLDVVREALALVLQALIEAQAAQQLGAGRYERTARCSLAASAPTQPRCCSTASAATAASPTGSPASAARPPPARSNASTRPCGRAAHRPPLRLPRPRPAGAGRLGGRRQHPASPPGDRHGRPGQPLPGPDHRGNPGSSRPDRPAAHRGSDRGHPPSVGQRPHRGLLPAGLSRPAPGRPDRHRPAPPQRAAGVLRRPAHPHRPAHQHQGGPPTPSPPAPPAQTTQDHLGKCQPSPGTKTESINRN